MDGHAMATREKTFVLVIKIGANDRENVSNCVKKTTTDAQGEWKQERNYHHHHHHRNIKKKRQNK